MTFLYFMKEKKSFLGQLHNWVTEDRVYDAVERIIASVFKYGQKPDKVIEINSNPNNINLSSNILIDETKELNRWGSRESIVLIKMMIHYHFQKVRLLLTQFLKLLSIVNNVIKTKWILKNNIYSEGTNNWIKKYKGIVVEVGVLIQVK